MARTCTAPLLAGPPVSLMFSSISKHTSIGTRCSDGTKVRRPAGLPPRPALLPPHLALQPRHSARRRHRRSTRRRSSRCDGIRHTGRGESQVRSPRQPELSGWPVSVQAVRAASPTWRNAEEADADGRCEGKKLGHSSLLSPCVLRCTFEHYSLIKRSMAHEYHHAWIQHTSCTHPIAGCWERSRIVGRQRYPARRP